MSEKISATDYLKLSAAERILLVEEIWDSITAEPEAVPITEAQRAELDRRLESYHRNPDATMPWSEVQDRLRNRA